MTRAITEEQLGQVVEALEWLIDIADAIEEYTASEDGAKALTTLHNLPELEHKAFLDASCRPKSYPLKQEMVELGYHQYDTPLYAIKDDG